MKSYLGENPWLWILPIGPDGIEDGHNFCKNEEGENPPAKPSEAAPYASININP